MSFALPLALLALSLVAGPIVAHYVRRTDSRRAPLPTIRLLERALAARERRRKLDDPWLFLLRLLAVVVAALAAAAPFVRVPVELGDGRAAAVAVVVDSSRSMLARTGADPAFELARLRAIHAIRALPAGSEVTLVLATDPPRILVDRTLEPAAAAGALESFPGDGLTTGDTLAASMRAALRRLHGSSLSARRLVVYSDFTANVAVRDVEVPPSVEVDYVTLAPPSAPNATIELVGVRAGARADERVVTARVRRFGAEARVDVALTVDGHEVERKEARATPEGALIEFSARGVDADDEGVLRVVSDDPLPEDDEVVFGVRAPEETKVLFVDGEPSADRFEDEVALASRALELVAPTTGAYHVVRTQPEGVGERLLTDVDVVVLANVGTLPPDVAQSLVRAVDRGLGLLIAPGDRVDGRAVTQTFSAIIPARLGTHGACEERVGVRVRDVRPEIVLRGLDRTRFLRCTELEPRMGRSQVPLVRGDGSPLFVLGEAGRGRVGVLGTALDAEGSDLPLESGFLALLDGLVRTVRGGAAAVPTTLVAGTVARLPGDGVVVRDPDGRTLAGDEGRYGPLVALGVYDVERPSLSDVSLSVVAPVAEADLRPSAAPGDGRARGSRQGRAYLARDVSSPVFALFGLALVGEGVLRHLQRGRRRASTTRSTPP